MIAAGFVACRVLPRAAAAGKGGAVEHDLLVCEPAPRLVCLRETHLAALASTQKVVIDNCRAFANASSLVEAKT